MSEGVSPWSHFGYPDKDLSEYPVSKDGYSCPNCNTIPPEIEEDDLYEVDGAKYPEFYNEYLSGTPDGTIHDWEELHCCPNCKTKYVIRNGCF